MKLLILTCSTGGGHTSAAKAIAQAATEAGAECRIVDALRFLPGVDGKVISHGHTFVYRHLPALFGVGYRREQRSGANVFRMECSRGARSLGMYISDGGYDAVVSVHIFASFMLAKLREKGKLNVPTANVATDYTCSPGFAECDLDMNFVPHGLADEFESYGLEREHILETGIPVARSFGEHMPRQLAREVLNLPGEGQLVLLMCGAMGCGKVRLNTQNFPYNSPYVPKRHKRHQSANCREYPRQYSQVFVSSRVFHQPREVRRLFHVFPSCYNKLVSCY